ncbi:MAG: GntR family transcriptional regulator [Hyphomicrobium sp.]|nr:GntR family transcriptional regulator [Hyphomicrobium sp.]
MSTERRRYRQHSQFILNEHLYVSTLDRNDKAKIITAADGLERHTKREGKRNGSLGYVAIRILRALLFRYSAKGRITSPSYDELQRRTGFSRMSIRAGLKRLQASGLLHVIRRITRKRVDRVSPLTGLPESFIGTVQAANVYLLKLPRLLSIAPVERKRREPSLQSVLNKQNSKNKMEKKLPSQWKEAVADAFSPQAIQRRRAVAGLR